MILFVIITGILSLLGSILNFIEFGQTKATSTLLAGLIQLVFAIWGCILLVTAVNLS
jgi:hypothetical protein